MTQDAENIILSVVYAESRVFYCYAECRYAEQRTLTEDEGSVQLTSSLR
jgi:hypothetical protein